MTNKSNAQVDPVPGVQTKAIVVDRQRNLGENMKAGLPELMLHTGFVNTFQNTWPYS